MRAVPDPELDGFLAEVSRSFYLSLSVLPRAVRPQISLAYLLARAADTIADSAVVAADERQKWLERFRGVLDGDPVEPFTRGLAQAQRGGNGVPSPSTAPGSDATPGERRLLARLGDCIDLFRREATGDRHRAMRVLDALVTGMVRDLERFPDSTALRALATRKELDDYCYYAAGCVGEYWTEMVAAHVPAARHLATPEHLSRGVRLGKALQLINVVRDAPADLAAGRCYIPLDLLGEHGLSPADLVGPAEARRRARPVVEELHALALEHIDAAFPYVMAIPRSQRRLRLACIWPLWIGLATLGRIIAAEDPLAPGPPIKIRRADVYRVIAASTVAVSLDPMLARAHWDRRALARKPHHK